MSRKAKVLIIAAALSLSSITFFACAKPLEYKVRAVYTSGEADTFTVTAIDRCDFRGEEYYRFHPKSENGAKIPLRRVLNVVGIYEIPENR